MQSSWESYKEQQTVAFWCGTFHNWRKSSEKLADFFFENNEHIWEFQSIGYIQDMKSNNFYTFSGWNRIRIEQRTIKLW